MYTVQFLLLLFSLSSLRYVSSATLNTGKQNIVSGPSKLSTNTVAQPVEDGPLQNEVASLRSELQELKDFLRSIHIGPNKDSSKIVERCKCM